jgi:hypothetical protein
MDELVQATPSAFVFISYGAALRDSLRREFSALHPVLHFWPSIRGVNLDAVAERVRNHFSATFCHPWELHVETAWRKLDTMRTCARWISDLAARRSCFVFWHADFHLQDAARSDLGAHLFVDPSKGPSTLPRSIRSFGAPELLSDVRQTRKPGIFVFDGPDAGGLYAHWPSTAAPCEAAFFASNTNRPLAPSLFVPLDAFSMCMLDPAAAFVDWSRRRRRPGTCSPPLPDEVRASLTRLITFGARAIARQVVGEVLYDELFQRHPVIGSFYAAFVVASKILFDEPIHPVSVPEIPTTGHHHLWRRLEDGVHHMLDGSYQLFRRAHVAWFRASIDRMIDDSEFVFPLVVLAADGAQSEDAELIAAFRERSENAVKLAALFGWVEPQSCNDV